MLKELEKAGLIGKIEKILHEVREIVSPNEVGLSDKESKEEHSPEHEEWLEEVEKAIDKLGLPYDEDEEDDEDEDKETFRIAVKKGMEDED